jgi:hypothetical protein
MNTAERRENIDLLNMMNAAIIRGKLDDYYNVPDAEKADFELELVKLCLKYNSLKKRLGM